jgi:hypothetical protein
MDDALKAIVLPVLRERGFKGSFPHFRRPRSDRIDLLTFQFDKWGGGFVMEMARCGPEGVTLHWGERVPPSKVRAWDVSATQRPRLGPRGAPGTDEWFRFDDGAYVAAATQVLDALDDAFKYWESGA